MALRECKPLRNFFQHGYVTNDFDRALVHFAPYGITRWAEIRKIEVQIMEERHATLSVALGYHGALQIEVIQPHGGHCDIHREILPGGNAFALRLHHHGFLLYDETEYFALRDAYAIRGAATVIDGLNPRSGNRYFYADTRAELGHYVEYIYLTAQGRGDYAKIPQNG
ncbi:MAG: VOC family protein [Novosphingobium sp.]|nr:VOC family protein [Novosphingobium sp.]